MEKKSYWYDAQLVTTMSCMFPTVIVLYYDTLRGILRCKMSSLDGFIRMFVENAEIVTTTSNIALELWSFDALF